MKEAMADLTAFDQYNHFSSGSGGGQQEHSQNEPPPRRARYARRTSVTQYNLGSYQPPGSSVKPEGSTLTDGGVIPLQPPAENSSNKANHDGTEEESPRPRRVARRCSVTQYNLYSTTLKDSGTKESSGGPAPVRQPYRRRSSVTQYNLQNYAAQQQQEHEMMMQSSSQQEQQPRQRYARRSSVTQYNLESSAASAAAAAAPAAVDNAVTDGEEYGSYQQPLSSSSLQHYQIPLSVMEGLNESASVMSGSTMNISMDDLRSIDDLTEDGDASLMRAFRPSSRRDMFRRPSMDDLSLAMSTASLDTTDDLSVDDPTPTANNSQHTSITRRWSMGSIATIGAPPEDHSNLTASMAVPSSINHSIQIDVQLGDGNNNNNSNTFGHLTSDDMVMIAGLKRAVMSESARRMMPGDNINSNVNNGNKVILDFSHVEPSLSHSLPTSVA